MTNKATIYGSNVNALALKRFLLHHFRANMQLEAAGNIPTPICIWGKHGIGKTEIVESLAREEGFQFAYLAPSQLEEMGDLLGMPTIEGGRTVFRAPEWVPTQAGPGILLIDDVNRADDRILRGIMQLLQRHALVSWALPEKWQIVLTANPDTGDYSVTPLDDAMLTRMLHITLEFDAKAWAGWAMSAKIDSRGINFVLANEATVTGHRTTPRTLVQFFQSISMIEDWLKNLELIQQVGEASLDAETVAAFITFLHQKLTDLPEPIEVLRAPDFEKDIVQPLTSIVAADNIRVDILYTLCTRLALFLQDKNQKLPPSAAENLKAFLLLDFLPPDLRFRLASELAESPHGSIQQLLATPEVGRILLG